MIIGNFAHLDSVDRTIIDPTITLSGGYYFFDDLAVYECNLESDSANAGPDQIICQGDSLKLGSEAISEYRYYWYQDTNLISREASPTFSPDSTTTYYLTVKDFKFDETFDTVTVSVINCDTIPAACAGNDTLICKGDSIQLGCFDHPDYSFEWYSPYDTIFSTEAHPWVDPIRDTLYILKTEDYMKQVSTDSVSISVVDCNLIKANAGPDSLICAGDSIQLGAPAYKGGIYTWFLEGSIFDTAAQTTVSPLRTSRYQLQVIDPRKTLHEDWCTVEVRECDIPLRIPNVVTPNGDGINDDWVIENPKSARLEVFVFNRWGSVVFNGDESNAWDGTIQGEEAGEGTYFFLIIAKLPPYRETSYRGTLTVLR